MEAFNSGKRIRVPALAAIGVAITLAVAACGSSSDTSTSSPASSAAPTTASTTASTAAGSTAKVEYSGPEAEYMTAPAQVKRKPGFRFSIGYLQPAGFVPTLVGNQKAAEARTKELGGKFLANDANAQVQKQVSNFNDLLAQDVSAVVSFPLDPSALGPAVDRATKSNVPVVNVNAPADLSQPAIPGYLTNVDQGFDYGSYATMKAIAEIKPGTAFGVIGTASPIPSLHYMADRTVYWGKKMGLEYTGMTEAQADNPEQWGAAANTLLTRFPDTKVIVTYQDPAALSALSAVRSSGHNDVQVATTNGYSAQAKQAIESGGMIASYAVPWRAMGRAMVDAAYAKLTKQIPADGLSPNIVMKGDVATKETLASPNVASELVK